MHLLASLRPFTDCNNRVPFLTFTSEILIHTLKAWQRYPFRVEPPRIGYWQEHPPGGDVLALLGFPPGFPTTSLWGFTARISSCYSSVALVSHCCLPWLAEKSNALFSRNWAAKGFVLVKCYLSSNITCNNCNGFSATAFPRLWYFFLFICLVRTCAELATSLNWSSNCHRNVAYEFVFSLAV